MRELITGQLHRHLKTVGVEVTEIIHTYRRKTNSSQGSSAGCSCFLLKCGFISDGKSLTSWYIVPVGSVDDVVVSEKVLVVARPPVWVGHRLVI